MGPYYSFNLFQSKEKERRSFSIIFYWNARFGIKFLPLEGIRQNLVLPWIKNSSCSRTTSGEPGQCFLSAPLIPLHFGKSIPALIKFLLFGAFCWRPGLGCRRKLLGSYLYCGSKILPRQPLGKIPVCFLFTQGSGRGYPYVCRDLVSSWAWPGRKEGLPCFSFCQKAASAYLIMKKKERYLVIVTHSISVIVILLSGWRIYHPTISIYLSSLSRHTT